MSAPASFGAWLKQQRESLNLRQAESGRQIGCTASLRQKTKGSEGWPTCQTNVMHQPNFEAARQYALERLQRELSPLITYHTLAHSVEEVVPAANQIAALEAVTGEDLLLLRTAAFYHDIGFVEQVHDHEDGSVRIVTTALPGFGYAPVQIEAIVGMILATQLPQKPHTLLEQVLADADLGILGQADYLLRNAALRDEMAAFGLTMTDTQWYGSQLKFIRDHNYFTASARQLCDAQKQINVAAMAALLAQTQ